MLDSLEVKYLAERDFRLRHLMQYIGDLEYDPPKTAFQSLAHSIIEQMLSMKVGRTIESRLIMRCEGALIPERVQALAVEEIKSCGMSLRKAESLHSLAEYALENDLEDLRDASDADVAAALLQLPGIGKWTCNMFLLFYLDRPNILPVEDGALRQSFEWLYGVPITSPDVQKAICSLWSPYSSTAVRYLYRALNIGMVKELPSSDALWTNAVPVSGP